MATLESARDELYGLDPDDFMARRSELSAAAQSAGDSVAAKQIGGLRKPTRSAYAVNVLVRAEPAAADRLQELGVELHDAQERLDGAAMRELSTRRNKLVDELARAALKAAGRGAAASLRDEIAGTLGAAIADGEVLERVRLGALVRAERWDGLGVADAPTLRLVPSPKGATDGPVKATSGIRPAAADRVRDRQQAKIAQAEQALAEAEHELDDAATALAAQRRAVRRMEDQLTDARRRLDDAEHDVRRARAHVGQSRAALDRARR